MVGAACCSRPLPMALFGTPRRQEYHAQPIEHDRLRPHVRKNRCYHTHGLVSLALLRRFLGRPRFLIFLRPRLVLGLWTIDPKLGRDFRPSPLLLGGMVVPSATVNLMAMFGSSPSRQIARIRTHAPTCGIECQHFPTPRSQQGLGNPS